MATMVAQSWRCGGGGCAPAPAPAGADHAPSASAAVLSPPPRPAPPPPEALDDDDGDVAPSLGSDAFYERIDRVYLAQLRARAMECERAGEHRKKQARPGSVYRRAGEVTGGRRARARQPRGAASTEACGCRSRARGRLIRGCPDYVSTDEELVLRAGARRR
ncbi:MAG: hypothetical protein R2939_19770 [Kofleriaceae bacterium]